MTEAALGGALAGEPSLSEVGLVDASCPGSAAPAAYRRRVCEGDTGGLRSPDPLLLNGGVGQEGSFRPPEPRADEPLLEGPSLLPLPRQTHFSHSFPATQPSPPTFRSLHWHHILTLLVKSRPGPLGCGLRDRAGSGALPSYESYVRNSEGSQAFLSGCLCFLCSGKAPPRAEPAPGLSRGAAPAPWRGPQPGRVPGRQGAPQDPRLHLGSACHRSEVRPVRPRAWGRPRVPACGASPCGRSRRSPAEHPGATQGPRDLSEHPLLRLTHRDGSRSPPSPVGEPGRQKSDPGKPSQGSSLGCRGDRPSKEHRDFPNSPRQRCGKLAGERALVRGKTFPGLRVPASPTCRWTGSAKLRHFVINAYSGFSRSPPAPQAPDICSVL